MDTLYSRDRANAARRQTRRTKNHQIKRLLEAARALEHAASAFGEAAELMDAPKSFYLTDTTAAKLEKQATDLLGRANDIADSDASLKKAWAGELELSWKAR
jgi:hypothetical protein